MSADGSQPGGTSEAPIFIGGVAGSGKTPLTRLLNRHRRITIARRTYMWRELYGSFGDLRFDANRERCLSAMMSRPGIQALDPDLDRIRNEFASGPQTYGELFALFHRHHAEAVGRPRWGEQLGLAEARAAAILAAYPGAKMIHMIRDPRSDRLATQRPGALGWATGKWVTSAELAVVNRGRYPDRYLVVKFEELARDPSLCVEKVFDFLEERAVTESVSADGDFPAFEEYTVAGGEAQPAALQFVERHTTEGLDRFGYEPVGAATDVGIRYTLGRWPADRAGLGAWNILKRRRMKKEVGW